MLRRRGLGAVCFFLILLQNFHCYYPLDGRALETSSRNQGEIGSTGKPYFLSVLVQLRNEVKSIVEFVQHYMEEGVDHVFIFDDGSTDGLLQSLQLCTEENFYTVFNSSHIGVNVASKMSQLIMYPKAYLKYGIRGKTEWLLIVDADEFVTSRAMPYMTIKEVLQNYLSDCAVISIPWLLYSWGSILETPRNLIRSTLKYRWGYHENFSIEATGKFRNRNKGVENKVLINTAKIPQHGFLHHAVLPSNRPSSHGLRSGQEQPHQHGGTVCVPYVESYRMACSANLTTEQIASYASIMQRPEQRRGFFEDRNHFRPMDKRAALPRWCPFSNKFRAAQSPKFTALSEDDIEKMMLVVFHYRVKSEEDWLRKTGKDRFNGHRYEGKKEMANRLDVYDDFMNLTRKAARIGHPDIAKAAKMLQRCPDHYFSNGTASVSGIA